MKILLIEDEVAVAEYLGMFLRNSGYLVDEACDARQARARVAKKRYDLVLLDLILPDGTGPEILPEIQASAPGTPVMIVTGLAHDDPRLVDCLRNGAAGYIPKSARADELLTAIRRALRD